MNNYLIINILYYYCPDDALHIIIITDHSCTPSVENNQCWAFYTLHLTWYSGKTLNLTKEPIPSASTSLVSSDFLGAKLIGKGNWCQRYALGPTSSNQDAQRICVVSFLTDKSSQQTVVDPQNVSTLSPTIHAHFLPPLMHHFNEFRIDIEECKFIHWLLFRIIIL